MKVVLFLAFPEFQLSWGPEPIITHSSVFHLPKFSLLLFPLLFSLSSILLLVSF